MQLSLWQGSSNMSAATDTPDLDFWEKVYPSESTLSQLKNVKLTEMSGVPHEMEFIKYLLGCSPALEKMSIIPCVYDVECQMKMLIEMLKFRRASTKAEIDFVRG